MIYCVPDFMIKQVGFFYFIFLILYVYKQILKIPRAKNKSRKIGATRSGLMKEAVEQIIENKASIRNVSEKYAISFTTLRRYVYKYKSSEHSTDVVFEARYNCRKAFSDAEKTMLKDYFTKASKIQHGVSAESARELAYQFAIKVNKSFLSN